jgi:hypothetical protein
MSWKLIYKRKGRKPYVVETFNKKEDGKKELDMRGGLVYALEKLSAEDIYILQRAHHYNT